MSNKRLIAGAMSGTSADGVDVAIVEVQGRGLAMTAKPLSHAYHPFPPELRKQILDVRQRGDVRLSDLAEIGRQVTLAHVPAFGAACLQANVSASDIAAIAAHGQTLFHGPPNTIQYFDPSLLAFETGCAVVSDFRRADLAAGGQGAPLVPFADWILFRHPTKSRVILNIGGIANLTYLKAGGALDEVIAFDTGPGNCISDWLMRTRSDSASFDEGGRLAESGSGSESVLKQFTDDAFFKQPAPKSTDGPAMIGAFSNAVATEPKLSLPDLLATAAEATGRTILRAIESLPEKWASNETSFEFIITGGGLRNEAIINSLYDIFPLIVEAESLGFSPDAREAVAFALLGAATLDGEPSNVPSATGAGRRVVLGSITPKPF